MYNEMYIYLDSCLISKCVILVFAPCFRDTCWL